MGSEIVAVFGGTGFLGRAIVRRLAQAGWRVRIVARRADSAQSGDPDAVSADIADPASVARAVAGARAVVNAVSLYVERAGRSFEGVHVEGAGRLARAARDAGVERFVHVSGIGADPHSASPYVAARARGESAVSGAFPAAVILRPSVLFGAGDAFLSTLDAVTRLPIVPLFGRGDTCLQPVHVDDVAAAAGRVLDMPEVPARLLELGGAEVLPYRKIVEQVMAHRGRRRPLLPIPFPIWRALAGLSAVLPRPPITRDQVILMRRDNVVAIGVAGFEELGIRPRGLSSVLGECL